MATKDLKSLYLSELQEAFSFEAQFAKALPELAEQASNPALRDLLGGDLSKTQLNAERLAGLLEKQGETQTHTDGSMQRLLAEAQDWVTRIEAPSVRDAALIAALQRILHYAMAVHGSLAVWAEELGLGDGEVLAGVLDDAKRADAKLTHVAQNRVNTDAAA